MKPLRIWLLLLAVLLPVRGALAAAVLCPAAAAGTQATRAMSEQSAGHEAMGHALSHEQSPEHSHEHSAGHHHAADAPHEGNPGHDHAASEGCNTCAAYCSLTPLVSELPRLAEPLGSAAVKFSDLRAPPPSFVSGGQERPPRTC
jgi:hypothetical protein